MAETDVVPDKVVDGVRPSNGGRTSDESGTERNTAVGMNTGSVDEDLPDEEAVSEAIEERTVEDASDEPAEPGEMHVEDDVKEAADEEDMP